MSRSKKTIDDKGAVESEPATTVFIPTLMYAVCPQCDKLVKILKAWMSQCVVERVRGQCLHVFVPGEKTVESKGAT